MTCPNCKVTGTKLGICLNHDCYADNYNENGYVVYCERCYNKHLITAHDDFYTLVESSLRNKIPNEHGRVNDV